MLELRTTPMTPTTYSLSFQRNTFQLVVASMASASYAILLYPRDGLQYFSTSIGGVNKPLEAGFNQGMVQGWFYASQGTYYRTTTDEETSIRELTEYETNVCFVFLIFSNICY